MSLSDRQIRRVTEERIVTVNEVNTETGHVSMVDQYGTTLLASLDTASSVITVPAVGEIWVAQRRNTNWFLVRQQKSVGDLSTLDPGDKRIEATGNLYLDGTSVYINGLLAGGMTEAIIIDPSISTRNVIMPTAPGINPLTFKNSVGATILVFDDTGKHTWQGDTTLYRSAASTLQTDGVLSLNGGGSLLMMRNMGANNAILVARRSGGDTNDRFQLFESGTMNWGPGNVVVDTNLYRNSSGQLKTDGTFVVGGKMFTGAVGTGGIWLDGLTAGQLIGSFDSTRAGFNLGGWWLLVTTAGQVQLPVTGSTGGLLIGGDANLFRASGATLKTDGSFVAGSLIRAVSSTAETVLIGSNDGGATGKAGFTFGSLSDTNLYRSAADTLKTDDSLIVAGNLSVTGTITGNGGVPSGAIMQFAGATAPTGWVICDGSSQLRTGGGFDALFAVVGTTYGSVDGTHFNLPDLLGRIAVGKGTNASVNALNANDGQVVANRRPHHRTTNALGGGTTSGISVDHSHGPNGGNGSTVFLTNAPGGTTFGSFAGGGFAINTENTTSGVSSNHTHTYGAPSGSIGTNNSNDVFDTPSFIVVNYIIKL